MKVFCTGASGYIGGSVATSLVAAGHSVSALVRSQASADKVRALGIEPVLGTLDDIAILQDCANRADLVLNAANADHEGAVQAMLRALEGSGKTLIHTSGSSIVGTQAAGQRVNDIYHEQSPLTPSPGRKARVALNEAILSHQSQGLRPIIICPSLIYGLGLGAGAHSMQIPWLIATARKHGNARHYGPGENIWSNVHINDLVTLYLLAIETAPAGSFYFAENGENSMKEMCAAINKMLGFKTAPEPMSLTQATEEWGEGAAENTMGSNSRVRAVRARDELRWSPTASPLLEEIENGCYRMPA